MRTLPSATALGRAAASTFWPPVTALTAASATAAALEAPCAAARVELGAVHRGVEDLDHRELLAAERQDPGRDGLDAPREQDAELVAHGLEALVGLGREVGGDLHATGGAEAQLAAPSRPTRAPARAAPYRFDGSAGVHAPRVCRRARRAALVGAHCAAVSCGSSDSGTTVPGRFAGSFERNRPMTGSSVIDSARSVAMTTGTNDSAAG